MMESLNHSWLIPPDGHCIRHDRKCKQWSWRGCWWIDLDSCWIHFHYKWVISILVELIPVTMDPTLRQKMNSRGNWFRFYPGSCGLQTIPHSEQFSFDEINLILLQQNQESLYGLLPAASCVNLERSGMNPNGDGFRDSIWGGEYWRAWILGGRI